MPETTKAVATKKNTAMALPEDLMGSWGTEEVTSSDIIIPMLLLMHGQSDLVQTGDANIGDLVISTTKQVVAKKGETVSIIPFKLFKTWINEKHDGSRYVWTGEEPLTPANADLDWKYTDEEGNECRRNDTLNFYALLTSEATDDFAMPVKLQFKRTSKKAGRAIAHFFGVCGAKKQPGCMKTWLIGSEAVKGDDNTYQVFTSKMGEDTPVEAIHMCKKWYLEMAKNTEKFKDDTTEEIPF